MGPIGVGAEVKAVGADVLAEAEGLVVGTEVFDALEVGAKVVGV